MMTVLVNFNVLSHVLIVTGNGTVNVHFHVRAVVTPAITPKPPSKYEQNQEHK